jgi:hypothetical protein
MAAGFKIPEKRKVLISVGDAVDKKDLFKPVQLLLEMKYEVFATVGTATFLGDCGIPRESVTFVRKVRTRVTWRALALCVRGAFTRRNVCVRARERSSSSSLLFRIVVVGIGGVCVSDRR